MKTDDLSCYASAVLLMIFMPGFVSISRFYLCNSSVASYATIFVVFTFLLYAKFRLYATVCFYAKHFCSTVCFTLQFILRYGSLVQ